MRSYRRRGRRIAAALAAAFLLAGCTTSPCGIAASPQYCPPPGPIDYAPVNYAPSGGHT